MDKIIPIVQLLISNSSQIVDAAYVALSALVALSGALIALFMLIPGEQPEKAIGQFRDFIAKYSRK
jgi:hypothetical protein